MRRLLATTAFLGVFLGSLEAHPQTCTNGTCVPQEDLHAFVTLAKEAKCREEHPPTLSMDPITILVDREGRIYGSGADPKPFLVHLNWCNYVIDAQGQALIYAAKREEPTSGFRFRPKATIGFLPVTALDKKDGYAGLDAGVLLEPVFFSWANINVYVGARSVGAGLGVDLLKNVTLYGGYAITWTGVSNPHLAVGLALF